MTWNPSMIGFKSSYKHLDRHGIVSGNIPRVRPSPYSSQMTLILIIFKGILTLIRPEQLWELLIIRSNMTSQTISDMSVFSKHYV